MNHDCSRCETCRDCHTCISNLERWGDADGREGRIKEIRAQIADCHRAWLAGIPEPLSGHDRLALGDELALLVKPE